MGTFVHGYTLTSALGAGLDATRESIASNQTALTNEPWPGCDVPCYLGRVEGVELASVTPERRSRNNALIQHALGRDSFDDHVASACARFGAARVGLVMGTSTSSIDRTEAAYCGLDAAERFDPEFRQPLTHNPHAPGDFLAAQLGLQGPRLTISAACASSAKVFATAKRWLDQHLVDAVVVGGCDSLCLSIIYGFHSLQLVSPDPCRPFSADRTGISLGEAAGFVLLTRDSDGAVAEVAGAGESCDAYHMSSAHPDGLGARLCMQRALDDAGLSMAEVDYVNTHGTGTRANDDTEGRVLSDLLQGETLVAATKGFTGHTLGAAGIVESVLCLEALSTGRVAGSVASTEAEADFDLLVGYRDQAIEIALSNSFGFGGNNCSVIFSQPQRSGR